MKKAKTNQSGGAIRGHHISDLKVSGHAVRKWADARAGFRGPQEGSSLSADDIAKYAAQIGVPVSKPASSRQNPVLAANRPAQCPRELAEAFLRKHRPKQGS